MFAVKGWTASADKLKVEGDTGPAQEPDLPLTHGRTLPRKRKRPEKPANANSGNTQNVTAANLSDMWAKVIEHKPSSAKALARKEKKRQKLEQDAAASAQVPEVKEAEEAIPENKADGQQQSKQDSEKKNKKDKKERKEEKGGKEDNKEKAAPPPAEKAAAEDEEWGGIEDDEPVPQAPTPEKGNAKDRKKKKQKVEKEPQPEVEATPEAKPAGKKSSDKPAAAEKKPAEKQTPAAPPPSAVTKLTPLQASMREKLISARFRHLNETLYTRPSAEAFELFDESPEMFSEYHEGFRRQVDVWPENPVEGYIRELEARAKVRHMPKGVRHDFSNPIASAHLLPLPRSIREGGICTVADLGCGDGALSARLQPSLKRLRLDVRSFDLQTGGNPLITRADIARLPLPDCSVDVAIFCLALMGTNWVDFVEEAYRVLRWKGELWIAEIKSRFTVPNKKGGKKVVAHSVGNRRNPAVAESPAEGTKLGPGGPPGTGKKSAKRLQALEEAAEADEAELAVEVDGVELRQNGTDVSAFVNVLRDRGFLLHNGLGEGAVDMRNKMFVKMSFIKASPAYKGKCVVERREDSMGAQGPMKKKKFFTEEDDNAAGNEAATLKPCVYKIR
ncbi:methyltransferase-domain-containing protein [Lasiosphaeria hispida]|uniref:Ribosomal RNA-processing protein 8 n=1 Tax=Lasiosphaeria hispida TaxID=260671 RepID=A0AAJ0MDQ2_9PEZI|nr:methyltransferase-domain-containing protein [Lasiosphaeria hispida]